MIIIKTRISKLPHERRAELISAAKYLFDKKGVEKTRVQDIVEHVSVAKGVFYYYFPSKDAMVQEVVGHIGAEVEAYAQGVLQNNEYSFSQKLAAFLDLYIGVADQFWADDEILLHNSSEGTSYLPSTDLLLDNFCLLFQQGIKSRQINPEYPDQMALVLLLGIKTYVYTPKPDRKMIFTLAAQALGLSPASVTIYTTEPNPIPSYTWSSSKKTA